jgi:hypothetical protein
MHRLPDATTAQQSAEVLGNIILLGVLKTASRKGINLLLPVIVKYIMFGICTSCCKESCLQGADLSRDEQICFILSKDFRETRNPPTIDKD